MTEINKDELKRIQIGILDKVTTFCEENNIRYSLYGGTLLGAIRHKGYIPWMMTLIFQCPDLITKDF